MSDLFSRAQIADLWRALFKKTKGHTHHGAALPAPDPEINREETPALSQNENTNTTGADDEGTCYD